jgi:hypothetical protein
VRGSPTYRGTDLERLKPRLEKNLR